MNKYRLIGLLLISICILVALGYINFGYGFFNGFTIGVCSVLGVYMTITSRFFKAPH